MGPVRPPGDSKRDLSAVEEAARDENRIAPAFPVVAIGASAGGLQAFRKLLDHLPADMRMAYVLIPHLDPTHHSLMSELLSRTAKISIREVQPGVRVEPGHAYVIPPNTTMTIAEDKLSLVPRHALRGAKHDCINHFMVSLAKEYRERAIGVILSGTASDGSQGIEAIKSEGGVTFAQDNSAEFKEMPRNAIATGAVDFVLPPEGIARELVRMSIHPYLATPRQVLRGDGETKPADGDFEKTFLLLKGATGVDFAKYKRSTVERRIARRMAIAKIEKLSDYGRHLEDNPGELRILHDELLINVTSFFREPDAFNALRAKVFPSLLKDRSAHDPLRVWVPGCSSGEEVYSIAITLVEFMEENGTRFEVQFFGTDVSERGVEKARSGLYDKGITNEVSSEGLRRFFAQQEGGGYQISKTIRDFCVFARQDVTCDPPFSRLDLLSCRNMLIYLGPSLQKRVIPFFHYALKETGFLLLGSSESVERYASLFDLVDKKHKIYSKHPGSHVEHAPFASERAHSAMNARLGMKDEANAETGYDVAKAADRLLLAQYVPAGIVVNDRGQVIEIRGETGPYLRPAPGKPSSSVLKMVREDLVVDLDAAVNEARQTGRRVRRPGVRFKFEERLRVVELEVAPIAGPGGNGRHFLVVFKEAAASAPRAREKPSRKERGKPVVRKDERDREIDHLKAQLASSREFQHSVVERHEAANEELRSSSEESLSANEELQSTNEELETAKEELQSANEELTTLNDELQHKNLDLGQLNSDLANVIAGVNIPLAIVDANLRLRRFTSRAEKLLSVAGGDIGRRITDFKPAVHVPDLERMLLAVFEKLTPVEQEVQDAEGRWYSMRIQPYRTPENRIEGAVIVFVEIDVLKRSMVELEEGRERYRTLFDLVPVAVYSCDARGVIMNFNRRAALLWGREPVLGDTDERFCGSFKMFRPDGSFMPHEQCPMAEVVSGRLSGVRDAEVHIERPDGSRITVVVNIRPFKNLRGEVTMVINCFHDVTERKQTEEALRLSHADLRSHAEELSRINVELEEGRAFMEAILGSIQHPFLVLDEGLRVKAANRAFHETFRVGKEETENVCVYDLGNGHWNIPRLRELLEGVVQKDQPFKNVAIEQSFEKIGSKIMLLHARRVVFRPDRPIRILLTIEDVTDVRHATNARLRLASVVDSSLDAIVTTSPNHAIMSWNQAAENIFGYSAQEVLGKPISILFPPDQQGDTKIQEKVALGARITPHDTVHRRKDGSLVPVSVTISPLVDESGKVVGASRIQRDISDRKRAEEEIRATNETLECRVHERTAELEASFKHLDTFTYTVSHDLRTPLRAMNSYSQMLIEDYAGKVLDETGQLYSRRIAEAARRMDTLVQDLLEYSRLTRAEIPIDRLDLGLLLSEVLKGMEREIADRKAQVLVNDPIPAVQGHRLTLDQVLTNLISNATKFVGPGVQPHVRVRTEVRDDWVRIWIEDNGIGIPPDHHIRIFGVFEHLHKREEYPGTGIGLAIVQKAMERMGGRVGLQSEVGRGSRFWIELPKV